MSRLVECVPNFSEGNNQEVRGPWERGRLGAAQGAQVWRWDYLLSKGTTSYHHSDTHARECGKPK